jgi:hypothetical protein
MLYTKITYTVEFEFTFTIMSFSGSESVYRRSFLWCLIFPVFLLSLAQYGMYISTDGGDAVIPTIRCGQSLYPVHDNCCIKVLSVGDFYIRYRVLRLWNNGSLLIPGPWLIGRGDQFCPDLPDCSNPDVEYVICVDVLSLGGWMTVVPCAGAVAFVGAVGIYPASCTVEGLLFYEYILVLSIVADIFCIVASIVAFRTALKRFTVVTIAAIGIISMILSVIDLGVHWNQFPRSVLFLMAISMARIVSLVLVFVVSFCIRVKTKEISEEKVPLTKLADVSINTQNEQEAQ